MLNPGWLLENKSHTKSTEINFVNKILNVNLNLLMSYDFNCVSLVGKSSYFTAMLLGFCIIKWLY